MILGYSSAMANKPDTPGPLHFVVVILFVLTLAGCSAVVRQAAPESVDPNVTIPGIPDARFWGDKKPPRVDERILGRSRDEIRSTFPAMFGKPHNYLAISGGGPDGAYGAGLLVGWTEAGNRPDFQIVTGISTGALIAPWAFLGPKYDSTLKELYTTLTTRDIMRKRWLVSVLFREAAADSTPLLNKISDYVDDNVIQDIAAEHKKGRRLFIGTTTIDHMRPMIWDIGAISASGQPGAYEAALPGTPVAEPEQPLEILRTIHSFDPCMACGVHIVDTQGKELTRVELEGRM